MRVVGKNNCKYLSPLGFGDQNIEPVQGLSRKIISSEKLNTGKGKDPGFTWDKQFAGIKYNILCLNNKDLW